METKIIPFKKSFGESILRNHIGPNNKPPITVYLKDIHKHGNYHVYRTLCENKVKTYRNKTFNQMSGILTRMGY